MFDYIHDVQKAYRKLIDSLAKPGTINTLKEASEKLDFPLNCNKATLVLMLVLLDTEVTFHVIGRERDSITKYLSQITYARTASLEIADFIIVLEDVSADRIAAVIQKSKPGDLINPHLSATLIIEVAQITAIGELILKGPGIEEEQYISVSGAEYWVAQRAEKNAEYPLGIEMYFVDQEQNLLTIPRTTKVTRG